MSLDYWILSTCSVIFIGVLVGTPRLIEWLVCDDNVDDDDEGGSETAYSTRGAYGDQFGLANAVFSGLAFLGVYILFSIERKEYKNRLRRDVAINMYQHWMGKDMQLHGKKVRFYLQQQRLSEKMTPMKTLTSLRNGNEELPNTSDNTVLDSMVYIIWYWGSWTSASDQGLLDKQLLRSLCAGFFDWWEDKLIIPFSENWKNETDDSIKPMLRTIHNEIGRY